jgi:hypothetical protein
LALTRRSNGAACEQSGGCIRQQTNQQHAWAGSTIETGTQGAKMQKAAARVGSCPRAKQLLYLNTASQGLAHTAQLKCILACHTAPSCHCWRVKPSKRFFSAVRRRDVAGPNVDADPASKYVHSTKGAQALLSNHRARSVGFWRVAEKV